MSAPSGPIQLIPPGLLGFLALKNSGQLPDQLIGNYQPQIDMRDWLFNANMVDWTDVYGGGQTPQVSVGNGITQARAFVAPNIVQVPPREWWWVDNFTVFAALPNAVTEFSRVACCMFYPPAAAQVQTFILGPDSGTVQGAVGANRQAVARSGGFWAPPGAELRPFVLQNETAGTIPYNGCIRLCPLPM